MPVLEAEVSSLVSVALVDTLKLEVIDLVEATKQVDVSNVTIQPTSTLRFRVDFPTRQTDVLKDTLLEETLPGRRL